MLKDLNRDFVLDESCAFESSAWSKLLLKARTTVDATAICTHRDNAVAMMWIVRIEIATLGLWDLRAANCAKST